MITHLLYRSVSKGELPTKQLQAILEKSKANNARDEISGILVYRGKMFLQLIEGSDAAVAKTFARIRTDNRHYDVGIMMKIETEARIFPHWTMGIPEAENAKTFDTLKAVIDATFKTGRQDRTTIVTVLKNFSAADSADGAEPPR